MDPKVVLVTLPPEIESATLTCWKIKGNQFTNPSNPICSVEHAKGKTDIYSPGYGLVKRIASLNSRLEKDSCIFEFSECYHHVVMRDLCAQCGANLSKVDGKSNDRQHSTASIPIVHTIPELHVSEKVAAEIALQDEKNLISSRKLTLLVDLDQTILHTSVDPSCARFKSLKRYRLAGSPVIYHTKFRPHLEEFLTRISKLYQLHICTFGNRQYAHQLASIIDPDKKFFSERILSRDECLNLTTKAENLKALFPNGVHMVCIIDDRGDVWNWSPNLIHVQPYKFFPDVGDINSMGLRKNICMDKLGNVAEEKKEFQTSDEEEKYLDSQDKQYLIKLEEILQKIHSDFYREYDRRLGHLIDKKAKGQSSDDLRYERTVIPNVVEIMNEMRKNIFSQSKVCVTLSGVVSYPREPHNSLIGKLVLNMGGILLSSLKLAPNNDPTCKNNLTDSEQQLKKERQLQRVDVLRSESNENVTRSDNDVDRNKEEKETLYTTHLVACSKSSDKVNTCLKYNEDNSNSRRSIKIVNPFWIWACHYRWEIENPKEYPLDRSFNRTLFDPFAGLHMNSMRHMKKLSRCDRQVHEMMSKKRLAKKRMMTMRQDEKETLEKSSSSISEGPTTQEDSSSQERAEPKAKDQRKVSCYGDNKNSSESEASIASTNERDDRVQQIIRPPTKKDSFMTCLLRMKEKERMKRRRINDPNFDPVSQEELQSYLPKTKDSYIVQNPLMHLPPKAASDMLSEIEDALLEEKTELQKKMPPEAELFNASSDTSSETSIKSTPSPTSNTENNDSEYNLSDLPSPIQRESKMKQFPSKQFNQKKRHYYDYTSSDDECNYGLVHDHEENRGTWVDIDVDRKAKMLLSSFKGQTNPPASLEEEPLIAEEDENESALVKRVNFEDKITSMRRIQLRKDLLIRRRSRLSDRTELTRINQRIWKLRRLIRRFYAEIRHYKARGYYRTKRDLSTKTDDTKVTKSLKRKFILESESSSEHHKSSEDLWDSESPKGWNDTGSFTKHRLFVDSPHIHSDPGLRMLNDAFEREWNTCPEGYDYADAEEIRAILSTDRGKGETLKSGKTLVNLTTVLRNDQSKKNHTSRDTSSSSTSETSSNEANHSDDDDDFVIDNSLFKDYL